MERFLHGSLVFAEIVELRRVRVVRCSEYNALRLSLSSELADKLISWAMALNLQRIALERKIDAATQFSKWEWLPMMARFVGLISSSIANAAKEGADHVGMDTEGREITVTTH